MAEKTPIWKEVCEEYPTGWKHFVRWFEENRPDKFNHSDKWTDTITVNDMIEYYDSEGLGGALHNLRGSITTAMIVRDGGYGDEKSEGETPIKMGTENRPLFPTNTGKTYQPKKKIKF